MHYHPIYVAKVKSKKEWQHLKVLLYSVHMEAQLAVAMETLELGL